MAAGSRTEAILDAALLVLADVGFDRLTMDAVAARAGSSKATMYRRWPGKAELVTAALSRHAQHAPELVDTGTLRGDLVEILARMRDGLADRDGALVLGVINAMRSDDAMASIVRERLITAKASALADAVNRAVARNELPHNADATLAAEVAAAVVLTRVLVTGRPFDNGEAARLVDAAIIPILRAAASG